MKLFQILGLVAWHPALIKSLEKIVERVIDDDWVEFVLSLAGAFFTVKFTVSGTRIPNFVWSYIFVTAGSPQIV